MKKTALSILLVVVMVLGLALTAMSALAAESETEAVQTASEDTIGLLYDDRKDLSQVIGKSAASVTIENEVVTSKKIGTTTADDHVLIYEGGKIIAVGTGTATIVADGVSYAVEVKPARLSMFLITGHSVGNGQYGTPGQSVAVEAGQAYSSFERSSLTSANGGLGYGAETRAGGTGTGALDAFAPGNGGTRGVGSALAYEWNQRTGEKVWVMNLAIPGSCINEWLPGVEGWHYEKNGESRAHYAYKYESVLTHFGYAQQIVKNEIAAGHYTLGEMAMFYFSGANFSNANYNDWSHSSLKSDYETFWNGLKQDLAMDMDGVAGNETLEYMGFVPIWTASNQNYGYDKAVNYIMAASADYPDVFIASDVYRDWLTTEGLATFPVPTYTTQGTAVSVPTSTGKGGVFCTQDTTHLSQVTYNAVGLDMAGAFYNVVNGNNAVTEITLEYVDRTPVGDSITVYLEEPSYVIVPALSPEYASNITVTASDNLNIVWPLAIEGKAVGTGTVTFTAGDVTRTLTVNVLESHTHCACGNQAKGLGTHTTCSDITFTPWGTTDAEKTSLPTAAGNYYLVSDIALSNTWTNDAGETTNICLNGHDITATKRAINIKGTLSITDCSPAAEWGTVSTTTKSTYGGIFYMYDNSVGNIYGGNWDASATAMQQGAIGIVGNSAPATLNIYDGLFIGGSVTKATSGSSTIDARGGAFYTIKNSTINMYGGTVRGGSSASNGGQFHIPSGSTLNIKGGLITGGTATGNGGNIYCEGKLNISGGRIEGGVVQGHGGNISLTSTSTTNISGGVIANGRATNGSKQGGNINLSGAGTLNITGGKITGGVAGYYGGNICGTPGSKITISGTAYSDGSAHYTAITNGMAGVDGTTGSGGNIFSGANDSTAGTLTISGGIIAGGKAMRGGNVYCDGNVTVSGGTIKEGIAPTGEGKGMGGNFYVSSKAKGGSLTVKGGEILDGTAADGGNIYSLGTTTISAGKVTGGRAYFYGGGIYNGATSRLLTVSGGTVSGGVAKFGGSIASFGNTTISGGTVSGGRAYDDGGNIFQHEGASHTLTVSGGTIKDGRARAKDTGTDSTDYTTTNFGGNIFIEGIANGTAGNMVLIDGTISGGYANCGGNIRCNGVMEIRGGVITGGQAKGSSACGGNLYEGMPLTNGEVISSITMSGGTIKDGRSSNTGGNAQIHGNFTMTGGEFLNGQATSGGNIRVFRPGNFVLDGGTISGGTATNISDTSGGNVIQLAGHTPTSDYKQTATLTVKSGTITGTVNEHGVNGGTIMVYNFGILNVQGGTINGGGVVDRVHSGKNYTAYGGTIYAYTGDAARPAVINISGGTINGGKSDTYGGVIGVRSCTGPVEINISGGTLNGGEAELGSILGATENCTLNITGGTFNGAAAVKGGLFYLDGGAKVNISGGSLVSGTASEAGDGIYVKNAEVTVSGDTDLTGIGSNLYVDNTTDNAKVTFDNCTDRLIYADAADKTKPFASAQENIAANFLCAAEGYIVSWTEGKLGFAEHTVENAVAQVYRGTQKIAEFDSFAGAAAAAMDSDMYVKLIADQTSDFEVTGALWLDMNGFDLSGITVSGTLYGMDFTTNGYEDTNAGVLTATGNISAHVKTTEDRAGAILRYLAVPGGENTYTFQRFYIGITKITLKPATVGVGYKAVFAGSETVKNYLAQEQAFGYELWINRENTLTRSLPAEEFAGQRELTLRVDNYLIPDGEDNAQRAEMDVYARVFLRLSTGEVISSGGVCYSFREMVEAAALNYTTYSEGKQAALDDLNDRFTELMSTWDIPHMHHSAQSGWTEVDAAGFKALFNGTKIEGTHKICLTEDVTVASEIRIPGDTELTICLNGHTLHTSTRWRVNGYLNIYDCCDATENPGKLTSDYTSYGQIMYTYKGSVVSLYGGELVGTKSVPGGGVICLGNDNDATYSTRTDDTVLNIYGGKIYGGQTTGAGGSITSFHGGTINMYGGEISGGTSVNEGGNLKLASGTNDTGLFYFNMYGGVIRGGISTSNYGGNIHANDKTQIRIYGGTIEGGQSSYGGNIYTQSPDVEISGGTITGGIASGQGGNLYFTASSNVTVSGGVIENGKARDGGNIAATSKNLTVTGGKIVNGEANGVDDLNTTYVTGGLGGNIYFAGVNMTVSGGTVSGGKASYGGQILCKPSSASSEVILDGITLDGGYAVYDGGNLAFLNKGTITLSGANIVNGVAGNDGGNIYLFRDMEEANTSLDFPTMIVNGGSITGGQAGDKGSGIYVQEGDLTLKGNVQLTGNTGSNLYLDAGQQVSLSELAETASIGVSMNIAGRISEDTAYAANLTSDEPDLSVVTKDGMLWLEGGLKANVPAVNSYSVGWHRGIITPQEPMPLDGMGSDYTRIQEWTIVTELEAGFTVIADETGLDNAIILVSVDTLFIQKELSGNLCAAISDATGIPANRIFLSASHSHTAVNHDSVFEPTREYLENFYRVMTEYAVLAVEDLKPATIETTTIDLVSQEGKSLNLSRRYIGDDGNAYSSVDSASYPAPSGAERESGSDPSLQLIRFKRQGGDDVILSNFGSHPADYNTSREHAYVSATAWKYFREEVQAQIPGTVCTFFLGAAGNVGFNTTANLTSFTDPAGVTHNASTWINKGKTMAAFAVYALNNSAKTVEPGELKVANTTFETSGLYRKDSVSDHTKYSNIDLDLNVITIGGNIAFVTSPYEMFHENGRQIKAYAKSLGYDTCFVLTNSMGENKYIGSYNSFQNDATDGKLTSFGVRTCRFIEGTAEMLIDRMAQKLAELTGAAVPETIYKYYTVKVVDQDGNAVQNVMLEMKDGTDDHNCTDADGTVTFKLFDGGSYKVKIHKLPAGYSVADMTVTYDLTEGETVTVTVQKD